MPMTVCETRYLGLLPYSEAHELQKELVERRKADEIPDQFLLLEHPHVITMGRGANPAGAWRKATPSPAIAYLYPPET